MSKPCFLRPGHFHPLGIEGWRFVCLTVAAISVAIGAATLLLAHDPRFESDAQVTPTCALLHIGAFASVAGMACRLRQLHR